MPTEFLHSSLMEVTVQGSKTTGKRCGHDPLVQRVFMMDFADEGVFRKDCMIRSILINFMEQMASWARILKREGRLYMSIKKSGVPVYLKEKKLTSAFDGKLNIEKQYFSQMPVNALSVGHSKFWFNQLRPN